DDEPVLVPVQQLDSVGPLVPENEDVPGQGVVVQVLTHLSGKPIEAAAQIDGLAAEPNADGGREAQHGGASSSTPSSCRNVPGSKPGVTRTQRPPARTTSMWAAGAGWSSGRTRTGTKVGAASRCCSSRRQA